METHMIHHGREEQLHVDFLLIDISSAPGGNRAWNLSDLGPLDQEARVLPQGNCSYFKIM